MKIYRFAERGRDRLALDDGAGLRALDSDDIFAARPGEGGDLLLLDELVLLPPVRPGKIVAVGRNYADHARELGNEPPKEPILFLKPPSAVIAHGQSIRLPSVSERVDFEGELAIVIGRSTKDLPADQWRRSVLGFTCANDVTARDLQKRDVQFTRGKSFDTFLPLGPCVQTDLDPSRLSIRTVVSGVLKQNGSTADMIFSVGDLIAFISSIMTLDPGDVILTGTPAGVGPLQHGQRVDVEIEGIGTLSNPVASEER